MKEKKYLGVYLDKKTNKYYVSTSFTTKDGYVVKKCKRGFDTAKKADMWKQQTAYEISNSTYGSITGGKVGMAKIIDEYIQYRKADCKPKTLKNIQNLLINHFLPYFNKEAKNITAKDILDFYKALSEENSTNSSKNQVLFKARGLVEYLDTIEAITPDVYRKFKKILVSFDESLDETDFIPLEKCEVEDLITSFDYDDLKNLRYKIFYSILAYTGCRLGEVLALRFDDLNIIENKLTIGYQAQEAINEELINPRIKYVKMGGTIIVPFTKTNVNKEVIIPSWLTADILKLKNLVSYKYLFQNGKNIMSRSNFDKVFKNRLIDLGYKENKIHSLRHYHTSVLYELDLEPQYIAERLGHKDETTSLKVYKHISKEKKAMEESKLKEYLN